MLSASANHRKFLTNVATEADLIVVDVNEEQIVPANRADRDESHDFGETRLAGLIRQHSNANFLFLLKASEESKKTLEQLE